MQRFSSLYGISCLLLFFSTAFSAINHQHKSKLHINDLYLVLVSYGKVGGLNQARGATATLL